MIRVATKEDMPEMLRIYAAARVFMKVKGNSTQWGDSYPEEEMLWNDIDKQQIFAIIDDDTQHMIGCFVLAGGADWTYEVIEEGSWRSDTYYGTIHRIASDGTVSGIFSKCVEFARTKYDHLRIDTHADNYPMQDAVVREGFEYRGIIYTFDGTSRKAYDWLA